MGGSMSARGVCVWAPAPRWGEPAWPGPAPTGKFDPRWAVLALRGGRPCGNLVRMTRLSKQRSAAPKARKPRVAKPRSGYWLLQDAKARFSELVRKVRSEGPQHVRVHGRDEVVV